MMRIILTLLIGLISAPLFAETPIVYSKCKATTEDFTLTRDVTLNDGSVVLATKVFKSMDVYDRLPDVQHFITNFVAPCDLVHRDENGVETVIHDCSTNGSTVGQPTCAALDVAVSFDGTQVTYALFEGTLINATQNWNDATLRPDAESNTRGHIPIPNTQISTTGAHLRTYTLSNGSSFDLTPSTSGTYDSGPAYVAVDDTKTRIAFTTNRTGHFKNLVFHSPSTHTGYAVFSVELDGTNMRQDSHHARSQEQHPYQITDGRLCLSSWQTGAGIAFRKFNSIAAGSTTILNLFKPWCQNPDGTFPFPLFAQHSNDTGEADHGEDHNALHNFAQTTDGWVWTANYYRGNNNALGVVTGFLPPPAGREGRDPLTTDINNAFMPEDMINLAPWGTNFDGNSTIVNGFPNTVLSHDNYTSRMIWYGKPGFPFALPSNGLGIVWAVGVCTTVSGTSHFALLNYEPPQLTFGDGQGALANNLTETAVAMAAQGYGDDIPGCNAGIYKTSVIPSADPSDLVKIVDERDYHEIYPRAAVPYSDIFGIPRPATLTTPKSADLSKGSPFAMLGSASITDRETTPRDGIRSDPFDFGNLKSFQMQGTDTIDYDDSELCGVRIIGQLPNTHKNVYRDVNNLFGERQWILGEFYVRNKDVNGNPIIDPSGNEDTSFLVRMPANMSYTMAGLDCDGRLLNLDQTWQSLKPGEQKTCGGCHVHSRDTRITFAQSHAATPGYVPFVLGEGTVPLMDGLDENGNPLVRTEVGYGYVPDFNRDIIPIFQARCNSCHAKGGSPGAASSPRLEADLPLDDYRVNQFGNPQKRVLTPVFIEGSTWYRLAEDNGQAELSGSSFRFGTGSYIVRPFLTKYMKAFDSRGSLLYWKAANQRTDNRTDAQFSDDIDFGADHPTSITKEELGTLARWIEMGAPSGSKELLDTHDPTLVLDATINENDHITELVVGTVDLGSGIDTGTLNVCLRNGATCTNIAPAAQLHGITTIPLGTPISDMSQVIEISVNDVQGNTTSFTRTAEYLVAGASSGSGTPSTVAINAGGNATITEGDIFSRTITFSDGEDTNSDGWTVVVDWNGVTENINVAAGLSSFNISRVMSTAGDVPVTVTITDDVGETAQGSFTITVNASGGGSGPLVIDTGGDAIVPEGATFTRTVSIEDPNDTGNNGWTYTVDWGGLQTHNGSIPTGATSFDITRFMPDGDAIMTVVVTVTDVAGDVSTDSFDITTLNVNPRGVITGDDTAAVNTPYSISLSITDPGDDTISLTSVDWGDGTFNNETSHTYTQPGKYRIKVQVVDEDGVHTVARKTVTVQ